MFHAKLALSDDEFELLMRLLKSSSDTEIKQHRSAWIQSMHQGIGKELKREQPGGVVMNDVIIFNT